MILTKKPEEFFRQVPEIIHCSNYSQIFINTEDKSFQTGFNILTKRRKYLLENGTLCEERVVKTLCSKDGHPCTIIKAQTQKIDIDCKNISFNETIKIYDLKKESDPLPLNSI